MAMQKIYSQQTAINVVTTLKSELIKDAHFDSVFVGLHI